MMFVQRCCRGAKAAFLFQLEDDYTLWFEGCWHWDDFYTFTTAINRLYVYFNSSFFMADTGFTLVFQQIKPTDSKYMLHVVKWRWVRWSNALVYIYTR